MSECVCVCVSSDPERQIAEEKRLRPRGTSANQHPREEQNAAACKFGVSELGVSWEGGAGRQRAQRNGMTGEKVRTPHYPTLAMASNLLAMASNLIAMASTSLWGKRNESLLCSDHLQGRETDPSS